MVMHNSTIVMHVHCKNSIVISRMYLSSGRPLDWTVDRSNGSVIRPFLTVPCMVNPPDDKRWMNDILQ
jgi:hypothetical protein